MIASLEKLRTAYRLGPANIIRFIAYRAALKSGLYRWLLPAGHPIAGPFIAFAARSGRAPASEAAAYWKAEAESVLAGRLRLFSDQARHVGFPPDWMSNVLVNGNTAPAGLHWTRMNPMGRPGDDIKGYWEPSRFDGLVALTLGWLASHEPRFADACNRWITDWSQHNPANMGVNWLCGQETGLRLLQTLLCAELIVMHSDSQVLASLGRFVTEHCQRIEPTMIYAVAQDNNHSTSEAAALYVGGGWLHRAGYAQGRHWTELGRRWLERSVARLVMPDGSFAQNSVNYHRLVLDTLSLVEFWRRRLDDRPFSDRYMGRFRAAADWLVAFTDPDSGGAPNLGANDGARLAVLHPLDYGDFRPSIMLAHALLSDATVLPDGPWNEPLEWLDLKHPSAVPPHWDSALWPDGGYAKLVRNSTWCMMRLPIFRFRPSHCDVLHLDLWHKGVNVLRDGGSFSYNSERATVGYFSGADSHNSVQFDDRDQMPRLGSFLFGAWPRCEALAFDGAVPMVCAAYRDYRSARHQRSVELTDDACVVRDDIADFGVKAVLRWRLAPAEWRLDGTTINSSLGRISIASAGAPMRLTLSEGWESHHYGSRRKIPVVEAVIDHPTVVTTTICLDGDA